MLTTNGCPVAKDRIVVDRSQTCSASTYVRLKLRIGSSQGIGKVTSSRVLAMQVP